MKDLSDRQIATMTRALRDFGYTVSNEEVKETAEALLRGEGIEATGIIGMFVQGWLRDAGLLQ